MIKVLEKTHSRDTLVEELTRYRVKSFKSDWRVCGCLLESLQWVICPLERLQLLTFKWREFWTNGDFECEALLNSPNKEKFGVDGVCALPYPYSDALPSIYRRYCTFNVSQRQRLTILCHTSFISLNCRKHNIPGQHWAKPAWGGKIPT